MFSKAIVFAISIFGLSGCAGAQLARNTLDVASSVGDIMKQQTLRNIGKQIDDPAMIPDQVDFASGTIETAYQVTPSITDPLTAAVANTTAVAKAAATTVTDTTAKTSASKVAAISGQHAWKQSWQVIPDRDTRSLLSLSLIYRYVVGQIDDEMFIKDFTLVKPNLHAADRLRCVICIPNKKGSPKGPGHKGEFVNPKLVEARDTLFWLSASAKSRPPPATAVALGSYSGATLYSTRPTAMRDFIFMVQDVMNGDDDPIQANGKKVVAKKGGKDNVVFGVTPSGEATTIRPTLKK